MTARPDSLARLPRFPLLLLAVLLLATPVWAQLSDIMGNYGSEAFVGQIPATDAVAQGDYRLALNHAIDSREQAQNAARVGADTRAKVRGDVEHPVAEGLVVVDTDGPRDPAVHALAQLFRAARRALPDLDARVTRGDFNALDGWLRDNVWSLGSRFDTNELVRRATGEPLGTEAFEAHLAARYLP